MAEVKEMPAQTTCDIKSPLPEKADGPRQAVSTPLTDEGGAPILLRQFAREMDRLFENSGVRLPGLVGRGRELFRREVGLIPADWSPCIEVSEKDGLLLVRADLPGIEKDDIQVLHTSDNLVIRGERKHGARGEQTAYTYSECDYGNFYRSLPLPEGADATKSTAELQNGVLTVSIPVSRPTSLETRRIEIREKK